MTNELGKAQASENMQEHATDADLDHKIRRRAYQIWMEEGQPEDVIGSTGTAQGRTCLRADPSPKARRAS
jgi:hypothetical protein